MTEIDNERITELKPLEEAISYSFQDYSFLNHALTHKSYANEKGLAWQNERYELLGDALLEFIISEYLFHRYPDMTEGQIAKLRAAVVSAKVLSALSLKIGVGKYMLLGKGEEQTGGRQRPSILADAFEAIICAIYFDGGLEHTKKFVISNFQLIIGDYESKKVDDYKTILQEITQSEFKQRPEYIIESETGPAHDKSFEVSVSVNGIRYGTGTGKSKKIAEQSAARAAIECLKKEIHL